MSTTYMNLTLPTVSSTLGPQWATELNAALTTLDAHNHAVGSGQQITPSGLNISSDLPFLSNNATQVRSVRFSSQGSSISTSEYPAIYAVNNQLYYNDGTNPAFPITSGGGVAGAPGSISGLTSPATAAFSGTTFSWKSGTTTYANMSFGSLYLREAAAGITNTISLSSPAALAASYDLTLPAALPASTKILTLSNTGAIGDAYDVDNSSIEVSSNTIRVKAGGVTNAMLAGSIDASTKLSAGTVGNTQLAAGTALANLAAASITSSKLQASIDLTGAPTINNKYIIACQTNGATGMSIIRGALSAAATPTIVIGEGFTISNPVTYTTRITFSTAFSGTPVATISSYGALVGNYYISTITTTYIDITDGGAVIPYPGTVSFIIIGLR